MLSYEDMILLAAAKAAMVGKYPSDLITQISNVTGYERDDVLMYVVEMEEDLKNEVKAYA